MSAKVLVWILSSYTTVLTFTWFLMLTELFNLAYVVSEEAYKT